MQAHAGIAAPSRTRALTTVGVVGFAVALAAPPLVALDACKAVVAALIRPTRA